MEELIDFEDWFASYEPQPIEYVAVYDILTGSVKSVGPLNAFLNEPYKIPLDKETAESIINCEIQIHNCFVDITSNTLEIAEIKNIFKLDDVLHRIISLEYSDTDLFDVYLTYNSLNKTLLIELTSSLGGTKILNDDVKLRKVIWDGDTEMNFLVTDYNDPNLIFDMFSVKINELINGFKIIENVDYDNFSVYTRRLFKNYVIEYK